MKTIRALFIIVGASLATSGCAVDAPTIPQFPSFAVNQIELILPNVKLINLGSEFSSVVASRAPIGTVASLQAASLPEGATLSDRGDGTALFFWRPLAGQQGKHVIRVSAAVEGQSATAEWEVEVVHEGANSPPLWNPPRELWLLTGIPSELAISATDADGSELKAEIVSAPPGVTLLTGPLRLRFDIPVAGAFPVSVLISNAESSIEATIWLHVQEAGNFAPVIKTAIPQVHLTGGVAWALPIEATDANGDPLTFSVRGPAGMHFVENELRWTPPPHGVGTVAATIGVSDAMTTTTHTISLAVVDGPNSPPLLPARGVIPAGQGGYLQTSLAATDAEGDSITYAVAATIAPATPVTGLSIDSHGNLTWRVPAAFDPNTRVYASVQATDSYSPPAASSRKYTIQVFPNPPPTATTAGPLEADRGVPYTLAFTPVGGGVLSEPVFLSAITLPAGATFTLDSSSYLLSWVPSGVAGKVVVGIRAVDQFGAVGYTSATITVRNRAPAIAASFASGHACLGQSKLFNLSASDADNDPLLFYSDRKDVRFWGNPVTGGSLDFTDYLRPVSNTVVIWADDGFGGTAQAATQYRIFGWRSTPALSNRVSILPGSKSAPLLQPLGSGENLSAEAIVTWEETLPNQVRRLHSQRIDAAGCPVWNNSIPSIIVESPAPKTLHAGGVNPYSSWAVYSTQPGAGEPCDASGGPVAGLVLSSTKLTSGAHVEAICLNKTNTPYEPSAIRLTGTPASLTQLVSFGNAGASSLQLRLLKATSSGAVSTTTYSRAYAQVRLTDYSASANASNRFAIAWADTIDQTAKAVVLTSDNNEVFPPVAIAPNSSNVRINLFDDNRAMLVYSQSRYLKFMGVNDNGSLATISSSDTLDDAGAGNTIGFDGVLSAEPPKAGSVNAYYAWSKQGVIYLQRIAYHAGINTALAGWSIDPSPRKMSTQGVNQHPRLAQFGTHLMVIWEQTSGAQITVWARSIDTLTGSPASTPIKVSTQALNALSSLAPLGAGIGISYIDYSSDSLHGDIALNYLGIFGNSRP